MTYDENYFNSKTFRENLRKYEAALAAGDSAYLDPDDLTDIAEYYHHQGKTDDALKTVEYAMELFPGAISPLIFRSRLALLVFDKPDEARFYAEKIDDKTDPDYLYLKAEIMIMEEQPDDADSFLREHLDDIDDEEHDSYISDVANLFVDYELFGKAQQWFLLLPESDDTIYKELKGRIALGKGNYEESEKIFNELLDEDPYSAPYWNSLASAQLLASRFNDSITSSEFSIAINPNDEEAIVNKANGLFSLGNYAEALTYYERYTKLRPTDEAGEMYVALSLMCLNRYPEAIEHLQRAEKIAPADSPNIRQIFIETIYALTETGRSMEALEYVDKMDEMQIETLSDNYILRGRIMLAAGNIAVAVEEFRIALLQSEDSQTTLYKIASTLFDMGYMNQAYQLLKDMLDNAGDDWVDGYSLLAVCCKQLGKDDEFIEAVRIACERNPEEARIMMENLFPEGMDPSKYYDYLIKQQDK